MTVLPQASEGGKKHAAQSFFVSSLNDYKQHGGTAFCAPMFPAIAGFFFAGGHDYILTTM
jgi:hypothetical protein